MVSEAGNETTINKGKCRDEENMERQEGTRELAGGRNINIIKRGGSSRNKEGELLGSVLRKVVGKFNGQLAKKLGAMEEFDDSILKTK